MSFFNKFIDKAKHSSSQQQQQSQHQQQQQQNQQQHQQQQQQPPIRQEAHWNADNSSTNSAAASVNQYHATPSSSTNGLISPPVSASVKPTASSNIESSDETTRMSLDNPERDHLMNTSSSHESLRANAARLPTTPILQQPPMPRREARPVSTYTAVFNDQDIISQRQNRPKLRLADFHMLRTLGTGSFGRVHLVQSRVNARYYAIKVLKKSEVIRLKQVEHTNNEKHILESVAHPFLVNMWGTFQDSVNLYMVMDYVPGGELFSVLRRSHRFPDHVAKFYAAEVILAIEYLHSKDMIYRDLKPENLLLDAQGHIKITDFGFAKHVPDVTWTLCGTPDYLALSNLAPEIIQSKAYGKAVDWWSLGVLIYEMLAGCPPFYDDDHMKLYEKILEGKIRWPQYFDVQAKDLLKRLLARDLTKRYGNLKGGSEDIKRHPWFHGVDFTRILTRRIRAPYVPTIRGEGDASHFDRYPESNEQYGVYDSSDPYRHFFPDF
ncbi:camp-dependent protein kinase catalytic subunit [Apophysomyces ossiformis]|uniref:cAMP-dependent protein kinase n=1 Tax=Apophysomyces ossiformis TaxID=679940 RepID=A0A8H7ESS7_9FUNG|nr:camp-dependent protein kinase catalytic subunit [Apophysomyces ossiformis]